jgi:hypothetical protein
MRQLFRGQAEARRIVAGEYCDGVFKHGSLRLDVGIGRLCRGELVLRTFDVHACRNLPGIA